MSVAPGYLFPHCVGPSSTRPPRVEGNSEVQSCL